MAEFPTLSKPLIVTRYDPAGFASVTRTTPVAGLATKEPLKLVVAETLIRVAPVGAAVGVTVVFAPTAAVEFE